MSFIGWSSAAIFNFTDNNPVLPNFATQELLRPSLSVVGNQIYVSTEAFSPPATNPPTGNDARFFLGSITIEPIRLQFRGVKRYVRTKRAQGCIK